MNYADYWTKHHPGAHHRNIRPEILSSLSVITELNQRKERSLGMGVQSYRLPLGHVRVTL